MTSYPDFQLTPSATSASAQENQPAQPFYFYRGRTALYALLKALAVGPGDEVIVQAYTCLAVILPIIGTGAKPVYVDVSPGTYTIDPEAVAGHFGPRTRALIVQHTFGIPAPLDPLMKLANAHGVQVIEDCCHADGSTYRNRPTGSFGAAAFYSFHWSKPLAAGRGGLALVNDPEIARRVAKFAAGCIRPSVWETAVLEAQYLGFRILRGSRLLAWLHRSLRARSPAGLATGQFRRAELQYQLTSDYTKSMAALTRLLIKAMLRRNRGRVEQRRQLGERLHGYAAASGISPLQLKPDSSVVFMSYPLQTRERERVVREARQHAIEITEGFTSPIDPVAAKDWSNVGYRAGSCPVAERLSQVTITLPVHEWARSSDVEQILQFARTLKARGLLQTFPPHNPIVR